LLIEIRTLEAICDFMCISNNIHQKYFFVVVTHACILILHYSIDVLRRKKSTSGLNIRQAGTIMRQGYTSTSIVMH